VSLSVSVCWRVSQCTRVLVGVGWYTVVGMLSCCLMCEFACVLLISSHCCAFPMCVRKLESHASASGRQALSIDRPLRAVWRGCRNTPGWRHLFCSPPPTGAFARHLLTGEVCVCVCVFLCFCVCMCLCMCVCVRSRVLPYFRLAMWCLELGSGDLSVLLIPLLFLGPTLVCSLVVLSSCCASTRCGGFAGIRPHTRVS
jgi:hypothetical protein